LTKVLVVEAEDKETAVRQPDKSDPVFDRAKVKNITLMRIWK